MGRNKDLSTEDIRMDALVKSEYEKQIAAEKYIEEAEEIIRHAEENVEDFPDDEEDQRRRFLEIMKEMRAQGQLTEEEEAQLFGDEADKEDESIERGTEEISATSSEVAEEAALGNNKTRKSRNAGKKNSARKAVEMPIWKRVGRTVGKWAAVVAVTCMGMFALTMTSRANRQYVADSVSYLLGRDVRVTVNNDDGVLTRSTSENEAMAEIKENLSLPVPILKYKPNGMAFVGYEKYYEYGYAIMHYEINNNDISLYISNNDDLKASNGVFDGSLLEKVSLFDDRIIAEFYEGSNQDKELTYGAKWNYENSYYMLCGRMDREDFGNILKKIWF